MIKTSFNWDKKTWTTDYEAEFERVKQVLAGSVAKYFPDWDLQWVLRVDANDVAVFAVLLQVVIENGKEVYHPIGFKSHKFSGAAANWDTHKKEAYAVFWGVKSFAYFLYGKHFICETDHRNLLFMEKSEAAIVIR